MSRSPLVAVIDSGIGGIPYLEVARALLPKHHFLYIADTRHFPYGERTPAEVQAILHELVSNTIREFAPDLIVIACNTASVVGLTDLRRQFECSFVGVVPAVKPAAMLAGGDPFAVLATDRTVEDPYLARLIREFAPDAQVSLVAAGGLVEAIESNVREMDEARVRKALGSAIRELREEGIRHVVLGCTHFVHVRTLLQQILGETSTLVDSVEGVARQIARVVDGGSAERASAREASNAKPNDNVDLLVTGPASASYHDLQGSGGYVLKEWYARNGSHR